MVGDAWGLHTDLDRLDRLEAGGMQHMGDVALSATRALASASTTLAEDPRPVVYYDILGYTMLAYSMTAARWLGVVTIEIATLTLANLVPMTGMLIAKALDGAPKQTARLAPCTQAGMARLARRQTPAQCDRRCYQVAKDV